MGITLVHKAPAKTEYKTLFLGGSITGAHDWQEEVTQKLAADSVPLILFNPRREHFDVTDPKVEEAQIKWEHQYLRMADAILFWFAAETLAPITLFELGRYSNIAGRKLFVGVHPDYKRKLDVEIQLSLVRPDIKIVYSIGELIEEVKTWGFYRDSHSE